MNRRRDRQRQEDLRRLQHGSQSKKFNSNPIEAPGEHQNQYFTL